jgi:hypothetical protein
MGYRFSLVLSREITDEETAILRNAGCASAVFTTDTLPTNADVTVTKLDFDDTASASLAEAIESGLDAVKTVPELTVPGLTVPAQPAGPLTEEPDKVIEGVVVEDAVTDVEPTAEKPAAEKPAAKKASGRRKTVKKASTAKAANGNGASKDDAPEPAEVGAGSA